MRVRPLCRLPGAVMPLLAATMLLAGCTRSPTEPVRYAPAERLHGTWRWVSALDVRTQETVTPLSAGFESELRFTSDLPTSGTFTYRRIGSEAVHGQFSITYEDVPGNDFITIEPGIDFVQRNAWVSAGPNNLHLGGVFELGYNSQWVRVPDE